MPYGIEIELEGRDPRDSKLRLWDLQYPYFWKIVSDGSINNGAEFVSHVEMSHTIERIARDLVVAATTPGFSCPKVYVYDKDGELAERVLREGLNMTAASRCGVHIHISPPEYINSDEAKGNWAYWMLQNYLTHHAAIAKRFTSPHRNKWAGPPEDMHKKIEPGMGWGKMRSKLDSGRYYGFNFSAMSKHGTVELRYFDATNDPNRISEYVELARTLNHCASIGVVAHEADLFPFDDALVDANLDAIQLPYSISPPPKPKQEWWIVLNPDGTVQSRPGEDRKKSRAKRLQRAKRKHCILAEDRRSSRYKTLCEIIAKHDWDCNMDEVDLLGREDANFIRNLEKMLSPIWTNMVRHKKAAHVLYNGSSGANSVGYIQYKFWQDRLLSYANKILGRDRPTNIGTFPDASYFQELLNAAKREVDRMMAGHSCEIVNTPSRFKKKIRFTCFTYQWKKAEEWSASSGVQRSAASFTKQVKERVRGFIPPTDPAAIGIESVVITKSRYMNW